MRRRKNVIDIQYFQPISFNYRPMKHLYWKHINISSFGWESCLGWILFLSMQIQYRLIRLRCSHYLPYFCSEMVGHRTPFADISQRPKVATLDESCFQLDSPTKINMLRLKWWQQQKHPITFWNLLYMGNDTVMFAIDI